jgi:hypothetical protein
MDTGSTWSARSTRVLLGGVLLGGVLLGGVLVGGAGFWLLATPPNGRREERMSSQ